MIDERLRLASALVHVIPGAALVVGDDQRSLVVGGHPSADVDPCQWRVTVANARAAGTGQPWPSCRLIDIGGCLDHTASGMFADRGDPGMRWYAASMSPCAVVDVLKSIVTGDLPDDAVKATVRPDPELGVTVVGVGVDAPCMFDSVDELAESVYAALTIAELARSLPVAEI